MKDQDKTQEQLIDELVEMRQRLADLETVGVEPTQAGDVLGESYESLLTILDSIDADVYIADLETCEILFMNQHMRASFGKDLLGKICWEVFRGEAGPCTHCSNDQLLDADGNPTGVVTWEGQNPITGRWYINHDRAIKWVDGRLVRLQVATDITGRKEIEAWIREEKEFTDTALDAQMDTFFLFEPATGEALRWNRAFRDISGYTDEEIARMPAPASYYGPEDLERAAIFIQQVLEEGSGTIELELICKDGRKVPTEYRVSVINDENGEPRYVISIGRDITERVRAERALRESERRYRELFENSRDGFVVVDDQGRFVDANQAYCRMLGYSLDELKQKADFYEITPPRWRDWEREEVWEKRLLQGGYSGVYEKEYIRKDGTVFPVELQSFAVFDDKGQPRYLWGIARDITERVQAEEALRRSEQFLQDMFDAIQDGISVLDTDLNVIKINRWMERMYTHQMPLMGQKCYQVYQQRQSPCPWCPTLRTIETGEAHTKVVPYPSADDPTGWIELTAFPLKDEQGQVTSVIEYIKDITEHKQAEKALRESETRFRQLAEHLQDAFWLVTTTEPWQVIYANPAFERLWGLEREQVQQDYRMFMQPIPAEEREGVANAFDAFLRGREDYDIEHRIVKPDGSIRWVWARVFGIRDETGHVYRAAGIAQDITERKRAEEALRRSLKETAHSQRLLLALSQAAQAVQRSRTPEEVYRTIGEGIAALGYHATIFTLTDDRTHLAVSHMTFEPVLLRKAEKLVGLVARDYRFRLVPGGFYQRIIAEGEPVFSDPGAGPIAEALPKLVRPLAGQLAALLGVEKVIYVPLKIDGETHSLLTVMGADLAEADVPAMAAFASQAAIAVENARSYQAAQQEITERVKAEQERERLLAQVREQAHQVQQIIGTVPEGVLLLDVDGRVVLANPVAKEVLVALTDAKVGDILTHLGDRLLAELLTSPPKGLWHEVKAEGPPARSFELVAAPVEAGSTTSGWVLVLRDVTQEREIQQRIQQQERLAAVGQLAAGIAHDFNNIMATIVLYTRMSLNTPDLPAKIRQRLETVSQQAYRATDLIQQILDFSRRAVLERRPIDLTPFLKDVVKLLERTVPESIKLKFTYGNDEYTVNADSTRVQQAIMNLVINARDAMLPKGGGELCIALSRTVEADEIGCVTCGQVEGEEWVRIMVTDTGSGIPLDELPHIFEPFFTTKGVGKGTGLGLAQVYGIVKQHEGHVDVSTEVGVGTTFTLYLPALLASSPEAPALKAEALVQGRGETVLVVEDDATLRAALVDILELLDYRVLEAADGREALDTLERHVGDPLADSARPPALHPQRDTSDPELSEQTERGIALVLSDLVMPEMGGQALFHAIRQRGLTLPVVMLSGHPVENELESLQAQGLAGWLLKPPSPEQLARMVAQALKKDQECS